MERMQISILAEGLKFERDCSVNVKETGAKMTQVECIAARMAVYFWTNGLIDSPNNWQLFTFLLPHTV